LGALVLSNLFTEIVFQSSESDAGVRASSEGLLANPKRSAGSEVSGAELRQKWSGNYVINFFEAPEHGRRK